MVVRILGRQPFSAGGFQEIVVSSNKDKGLQPPGMQSAIDRQGSGQANRIVAPQAMMFGQFNSEVNYKPIYGQQMIFTLAVEAKAGQNEVAFFQRDATGSPLFGRDRRCDFGQREFCRQHAVPCAGDHQGLHPNCTDFGAVPLDQGHWRRSKTWSFLEASLLQDDLAERLSPGAG